MVVVFFVMLVGIDFGFMCDSLIFMFLLGVGSVLIYENDFVENNWELNKVCDENVF